MDNGNCSTNIHLLHKMRRVEIHRMWMTVDLLVKATIFAGILNQNTIEYVFRE